MSERDQAISLAYANYFSGPSIRRFNRRIMARLYEPMLVHGFILGEERRDTVMELLKGLEAQTPVTATPC